MGVACGLSSPTEWLLNYTLHQTNFEVYSEIPENYKLAIEAYAAFWRSTAGYQEEQEFFSNSDDQQVIEYVYQNAGAKLRP